MRDLHIVFGCISKGSILYLEPCDRPMHQGFTSSNDMMIDDVVHLLCNMKLAPPARDAIRTFVRQIGQPIDISVAKIWVCVLMYVNGVSLAKQLQQARIGHILHRNHVRVSYILQDKRGHAQFDKVAARSGYGMGMKEIFALLARSYDARIQPKSASGPLEVQMNITLEHVVDIDVKRGELQAVIGMHLRWSDSRLSWKVDDTDGPIEKVVIPLNLTWLPGITITNLIAPIETVQSGSATVNHRGSITWLQVYRINTHCATNMSASIQTCRLMFLSWTYDMDSLRISLSSDEVYVNDMGLSSNNWELHSSALNQTLVNFTCCEKPFEGITADLNFIRIGSEPTESEDDEGNPAIVSEPTKRHDEKQICNTGTSSGNHQTTVREIYMLIALVLPLLKLCQRIAAR